MLRTVLQPVELHHSWPLEERDSRFALGTDLPLLEPAPIGMAGHWSCDLSDQALTWGADVYALFGLPRSQPVRRDAALACYADHSRAAMERLRAHALRHRRGFAIDIELRPATGGRRIVRLIAAPTLEDGRPVRLEGFKLPLD